MGKRWQVAGAVLVGLGLSAGAVILFFFINKEKLVEVGKPKQILPYELTTEGFDPTVNTPVFKVISGDDVGRTLNVKMIFPDNSDPQETTIMVVCSDEDIIVRKQGEKIGVGWEALFEVVEGYSKELMTFRGLCSDRSCKQIYRNCVLSLQIGRGYEK